MHTPKHGSWLNVAEIELSVLSRQCLDRRVPDFTTRRMRSPLGRSGATARAVRRWWARARAGIWPPWPRCSRDRQAPLPNYQALIYPITNFAFTTPSYLQNANAPYLTRAAMVLATVPDHAD